MVVAVMMTVMRVPRSVSRDGGTGEQNHTQQAEQHIAHLHRLTLHNTFVRLYPYVCVDKHNSPN